MFKDLKNFKTSFYQAVLICLFFGIFYPSSVFLNSNKKSESESYKPVSILLRWILKNNDHLQNYFAIIDKKSAELHVFNPDGVWIASSPVLLGAAIGDYSAPEIGKRRLSEIRDHEKTTPAGRFITEPGRNLKNEEIIWIDYDAAISLHRVRVSRPEEKRLQRLASMTPEDNRISYGCINVPESFYDKHIDPVFGRQQAVVYILPEAQPIESFFNTR